MLATVSPVDMLISLEGESLLILAYPVDRISPANSSHTQRFCEHILSVCVAFTQRFEYDRVNAMLEELLRNLNQCVTKDLIIVQYGSQSASRHAGGYVRIREMSEPSLILSVCVSQRIKDMNVRDRGHHAANILRNGVGYRIHIRRWAAVRPLKERMIRSPCYDSLRSAHEWQDRISEFRV